MSGKLTLAIRMSQGENYCRVEEYRNISRMDERERRTSLNMQPVDHDKPLRIW